MFFTIYLSSCERKPNYEHAIKKLVGKTWLQVQKCIDDSCYDITAKKIYYYFPAGFKSPIRNNDSASIQFDCYDIRHDGSIELNEVFHSWIIFYSDSSVKGGIYPTVLTWDNVRQRGNISFISDSEFVLFRHSPKFEIPERDVDIDTRDYFKLTNTPRDILNTDR